MFEGEEAEGAEPALEVVQAEGQVEGATAEPGEGLADQAGDLVQEVETEASAESEAASEQETETEAA